MRFSEDWPKCPYFKETSSHCWLNTQAGTHNLAFTSTQTHTHADTQHPINNKTGSPGQFTWNGYLYKMTPHYVALAVHIKVFMITAINTNWNFPSAAMTKSQGYDAAAGAAATEQEADKSCLQCCMVSMPFTGNLFRPVFNFFTAADKTFCLI